MTMLSHPRSHRVRPLTICVIAAAVIGSACGSTSTESVFGPVAPKCSVALTAPPEPIAADGGSGALVVSTQPECAWSPTADASWIADVAPAQGQGNGEVQFTAASNPNGVPREAAITVNGQRAVIRQAASPCQLHVSVSQSPLPAGGGSAVLTVSAPGGCPWTVLSEVGWITVSPTSGSGSGSVTLTVASHAGPERTGTLTVGGLPIAIAQAAAVVTGPSPAPGVPPPPPPPGCVITVQPSSASMPAAGGSGSALITTNAGCAWAASSLTSWITVTTATSGSGSGSIGFTVGANPSTTGRIGSINISGTVFTVSQSGTSGQTCTISINPSSQTVGTAGATGLNVNVSTGTGCAWTAASNDAWLTIVSGQSGSGSGVVMLNASANTGSARTGTATIGGRTFTVTQSGCVATLSPQTQSVGALGGAFTVSVTTQGGCPWTATSNAGWVTVTGGGTGTGSGTVSYTVGLNLLGSRSTTLTIAGQTLSVNQAGVLP